MKNQAQSAIEAGEIDFARLRDFLHFGAAQAQVAASLDGVFAAGGFGAAF